MLVGMSTVRTIGPAYALHAPVRQGAWTVTRVAESMGHRTAGARDGAPAALANS